MQEEIEKVENKIVKSKEEYDKLKKSCENISGDIESLETKIASLKTKQVVLFFLYLSFIQTCIWIQTTVIVFLNFLGRSCTAKQTIRRTRVLN